MGTTELHELISDTLYHEMRCLLGSATLWDVWRRGPNSGYDVIVAMDSALVHARCLFEVMTKDKTRYDVSITLLPGVRARKSPLFSQDEDDPRWREPLNRHVMHASPHRSTPSNMIDGVHLNTMVVDFALEILRLWRSVESDVTASDLQKLLKEVRERALDDAANDARRHRAQPIFTIDSGTSPPG